MAATASEIEVWPNYAEQNLDVQKGVLGNEPCPAIRILRIGAKRLWDDQANDVSEKGMPRVGKVVKTAQA